MHTSYGVRFISMELGGMKTQCDRVRMFITEEVGIGVSHSAVSSLQRHLTATRKNMKEALSYGQNFFRFMKYLHLFFSGAVGTTKHMAST